MGCGHTGANSVSTTTWVTHKQVYYSGWQHRPVTLPDPRILNCANGFAWRSSRPEKWTGCHPRVIQEDTMTDELTYQEIAEILTHCCGVEVYGDKEVTPGQVRHLASMILQTSKPCEPTPAADPDAANRGLGCFLGALSIIAGLVVLLYLLP